MDSNLGTTIQTSVVLAVAYCLPETKKRNQVAAIDEKNYFIILSGLYNRSVLDVLLQRHCREGSASVVVPIDKLSILVTIAFSKSYFMGSLLKGSGGWITVYDEVNWCCDNIS